MSDLTMTRIYIKLQRHTNRGPVYKARLGSPEGPVLVNSSLEPIFAASRVLIGCGITGKIEMWDSVRPFPRMSGDIARLAKLTVREDSDTSPTLCRWRPFPTARGKQKAGFGMSMLLKHPRTETAKKPPDRAARKE